MALYRRLLSYLRPHWWRMAGTIASSSVAAALDAISFTLLIPFLNSLFHQSTLTPPSGLIKQLLDRLVGAFLDPLRPLHSLEVMIVAIVIIVAIKNVFVWVSGQLGASLQELVTRDLRDRVFTHLQRLPLGYFQRTKTGQVISKVLSDTEQTKALITEIVTKSVQNTAQIVATVVMLLSMSGRLTVLSLVVAPLLTLALLPILRRLRHAYRRLRNEYGEITSVLQEVVSGIRLVKSFAAEPYEDGRFTEVNHGYSSGMVRVARMAVLSQPLTEVIGTSVAVLILWIGARQVLAPAGVPAIDGATLITFMILVMRLLSPLKQLTQMPTTAQQSLAAAERLFGVLDQPTEAETDRGTVQVLEFRERIVFEHVGFAYDREPVLTDIGFTARKGEIVALVGPSGAGKSTLVDLIPRFYEPTSGRIVLDGLDTREITLPSLRALTGIVSQDTVLFNDTVRNNIAYGAGDRYSDAQVQAAARAANAHGFIAELPNGYDTVLGERGTRLSGGQRQRIAIARALLVDPPMLILDEATSALDTESERQVQEAIDRLLAGRTVFVIAHRLSTIAHASQILVLDRGRIVERGTHAELLALGGAYHRLHSLQFRDDHAPVPTPDADAEAQVAAAAGAAASGKA
jgi:ATP-binding cassette, subfamily B, bacterial MsbA